MTKRRVAVLGSSANETNVSLVSTWRRLGLDCGLVGSGAARAEDYDVVLGRLDVLPTLDGVEPGLLGLLWLERAGVRVLNPCSALLATHDKLRTAGALGLARVPHPETRHVAAGDLAQLPEPPFVLKPRFGSWGRDVHLCRDGGEAAAVLAELGTRRWFRRHGVLVQTAVPSPGFDLRVVVAGRRVVGAIERHAQPGEWRTNVSLGADRLPATPSADASALAVAAAVAVGADLVGVDLMPLPSGGYTVIELNGAVDFTQDYALDGDIYVAVARALGLSERAPASPAA